MLPSYEEHVPVFNAVARGDAEAARQAMANHMHSAASRLRANLPSRRATGIVAIVLRGHGWPAGYNDRRSQTVVSCGRARRPVPA